MRVTLPFVMALGLLCSCVGRVEDPPPEPVAEGQRECWVDEECVVVREVSGCCAGCAGVVPLALAEAQACLVEVGAAPPAACFDAGCPAEPACGALCLEPVGAECVQGKCLPLFDCEGDQTAPVGTFCDG